MTLSLPPLSWAVSGGLVPYPEAIRVMEARARAIREDGAPELVWFLEHPPLYTAGTSAAPADLRDPDRFPVFASGRGGKYTYHGPGQRVVYLMLDVAARGRDVRQFVGQLEAWIIAALEAFAIKGAVRPGRVGVWVDRTEPGGPLREEKIAAIGVRLKRWVSLHGLAINVDPDLGHFGGITPCGISDPAMGVTSLAALGRTASLTDLDIALRDSFPGIFGARLAPAPCPLAAGQSESGSELSRREPSFGRRET
jgi:lipoyl(octanoyl) transferase